MLEDWKVGIAGFLPTYSRLVGISGTSETFYASPCLISFDHERNQ
jgi:hypothetical protein